MSPNDLLLLWDLKTWLGITSTQDDAVLSAIITSISNEILTYLGRPILNSQSFTETRDGTGTARMMVLNFPLTAVASLTIDGVAISVSGSGVNPGYVFDQFSIALVGVPPYLLDGGSSTQLYSSPFIFRSGKQNVVINYTAGFSGTTSVTGELQTIPAAAPYQLVPFNPYPGFTDAGVSYAGGAALTKVSGTPTTGQYAVNQQTGLYTFASGDASRQVALSYSYGALPPGLTQAAKEICAEKYQGRKRIGIKSISSKTGESSTFDRSMWQDRPPVAIAELRRVAPV